MAEKILSQAGLELETARSEGPHLTHCATRAPLRKETSDKYRH